MREEVGLHWEKGVDAPKTYELMAQLREQARATAASAGRE